MCFGLYLLGADGAHGLLLTYTDWDICIMLEPNAWTVQATLVYLC